MSRVNLYTLNEEFEIRVGPSMVKDLAAEPVINRGDVKFLGSVRVQGQHGPQIAYKFMAAGLGSGQIEMPVEDRMWGLQAQGHGGNWQVDFCVVAENDAFLSTFL